MKPADVKSNTYIGSSKEINNEDPEFKIGFIVIKSKNKNIFAKGYTPSWSEEVLWLKKLKVLCHGHMLLMILMEKKLLKLFRKKIVKNESKRV